MSPRGFLIVTVCRARNIKTTAAFANWLASFCVYYIPQAMPRVISQTHCAFYHHHGGKTRTEDNLTYFGYSPWARNWNPPPFLQTCIIPKLHPRVFEKCMFVLVWLVGVAVQQHSFPQQSHRLPTPRDELISSQTPLPTKITLRVIWGKVFLISCVS